MVFFNLNYNQLLLYGVHVGHSLSNTLLYSAWMVSAFRQSISIINLFKSIIMFRFSFLLLTNIISLHGPIWFINLDKSVDRYVRYSALNCGEFSATGRWIRGSISNYRTVFNAYRRLNDLSGTVLSVKKKGFSSFFSNWFLTRYSWPRAVFISSLHFSYFPAKEALSLKIPSISVVDTNSWTQAASIAIPGNDESLGCLVFYNDIISNFILSRKFNLVSLWYFNIRSISRVVSFTDWVSRRYTLAQTDLANLITFKPATVTNYLKSFGLFLSHRYQGFTQDRLEIFHPRSSTLDLSYTFPKFLTARRQIIMSLNFHFFKKTWLFKGFFKKNFFSDYTFKSKFLKTGFFQKKFLTKSYLKMGLRSSSPASDFFFAVSNLFFFQKYYSKKSLPQIPNFKINYWKKVSALVVNQFNQKLKLWNRQSSPLTAASKLRKIYRKGSKLKIRVNPKTSFLARTSSPVAKFFVSDVFFDSKIPSYLWRWNFNYFVPSLQHSSSSVKGYFFRKFLASTLRKGNSAYFLGHLNTFIHRASFPQRHGVKWIWY